MSRRGRAGVLCTVGLLLFANGATRAQAPSPTGGDRNAPERGHYELRSTANGTYFYREPGFSASIAADGTVTFHDASWKPQSKTFDLVTNAGKGANEILNSPGQSWNDRLAYRGDVWKPEPWPVPLPDPNRPTLYDLHDQAQAMDPMRPEIPIAAPIFADPGLRADLTDQYIRLMGNDPYGPQKAAFLAGTFDMRMQMASRQHRANVRAAMGDLSRELGEIWNDPRYSVAERSGLIYLLWQDTSGTDPDARQARRMIEDFAHRNLPPAEAARFASPGEKRGHPGGTELPAIKTDVTE